MKRSLVVVASLVVLLVVLVSGEAGVVELDESNFDSKINQGDWLVEFYAPWCGHCKKLIPTYDEVASILEGDVNVAKVDGSKHKNLATRFKVKGFPTIILLKGGKMSSYNGERTAEDISTFALKPLAANSEVIPPFVKSKPRPPPPPEEEIDITKSKVVILDSDVLNSLNNGSEWLVQFYAPWCGFCKRLAPVWEKLAISLKDKNSPIKVAKIDGVSSSNRGVSRSFNIEHFPQIFYIRSDGMREYVSSERTVDAIEEFLTKNYKTLKPIPVPSVSFFNHYLGFFDVLLEPWNDWINENIVLVTIAIIGGGLLMGAMMGKLTLEIIKANRPKEEEEEGEEEVQQDASKTANATKSDKVPTKTKDNAQGAQKEGKKSK